MSYLAYAGIGSRDTPAHILQIMTHCSSYLYEQGWTLRSGGAEGADLAFERGVRSLNDDVQSRAKEIYLPWAGFNHSVSILHPGNFPFSDQEIQLTADTHPAWDKCGPGARKMHTRNLRQIIGLEALHGPMVMPVHFVLCWTDKGQMKGGTSQALRIAQACQIEVINFGTATNTKELEALVLKVDELQAKAKGELGTVQRGVDRQ